MLMMSNLEIAIAASIMLVIAGAAVAVLFSVNSSCCPVLKRKGNGAISGDSSTSDQEYATDLGTGQNYGRCQMASMKRMRASS